MKYFSWIFLATAILSGCKVDRHHTTSTDLSLHDPPQEILLYLTFEIYKTDLGEIDIELIQVRRTKHSGRSLHPDEAIEKRQLLFQFLDKNKGVIGEELRDNPLFKTFETYTESRAIERKEGQLDHSKMLLRSRISKNVVFVKVTDTEGFEKTFEI